MDVTTLLDIISKVGFPIAVVVAMMFGLIVPKPFVSKLEKENAFLREDNRLKSELNRELTSTIANNNQLIGELRSLAHQRHREDD